MAAAPRDSSYTTYQTTYGQTDYAAEADDFDTVRKVDRCRQNCGSFCNKLQSGAVIAVKSPLAYLCISSITVFFSTPSSSRGSFQGVVAAFQGVAAIITSAYKVGFHFAAKPMTPINNETTSL